MDIAQFLIHLPVSEHLGCFLFWAIVTNATMNIHVHLCGHIFSLLLGIYLGMEFLSIYYYMGHIVIL